MKDLYAHCPECGQALPVPVDTETVRDWPGATVVVNLIPDLTPALAHVRDEHARDYRTHQPDEVPEFVAPGKEDEWNSFTPEQQAQCSKIVDALMRRDEGHTS